MSRPVPAGQADRATRKRIGRYAVTGRIGRGGMGVVYRGYDETLEREVAIKTLSIEGTLDDESRQRFAIEAKAAARLQHPNILTVFELGEERGVPFIAMELLPGVDLEALLRSGEPLLLQEKLEIVIQVCRGLAYAHEHKIVHRDIKPSNIRLLDDGSVKIMDFGIAKLQGTGVTRSGMMVGTVHYMSPEQIRGQPLDGRSDVFSVGVILYELLTGRRPFAGRDTTEVLYKIVHQEPLPLDDAGGSLSPRLREVVERALCKERERRFAGAALLADELGALLAELSRGATLSFAAADLEALNQSWRLLRDGHVDEAERRLGPLRQRLPSSLEVRRALRSAARERTRRQRLPEAPPDDFPELDATFQSPATRLASQTGGSSAASPTSRSPELTPRPTVLAPSAGPRPAGRLLVAGAALALVAALLAAVFLIRGGPARPSASAARVSVRSEPPGAHVLLDGQETGVVTDAELSLPVGAGRVLLTFRKPGHREESRSLTLPPGEREQVSVVLTPTSRAVSVTSDPPGAALSVDGQPLTGRTPLAIEIDPAAPHLLDVSLEGYKSRQLRLEPGETRSELHVGLEPSAQPGSVRIASSFPIDVSSRGRVLVRAQTSARLSLPAGRHELLLSSAAYFLRSNVWVDVRGGAESALQAPGLGKISIKAIPDNCQILIDGVFVDYPPILEKPLAAGRHTVSFKWPDGARRDELAEVPVGGIQYVMGRRP